MNATPARFGHAPLNEFMRQPALPVFRFNVHVEQIAAQFALRIEWMGRPIEN